MTHDPIVKTIHVSLDPGTAFEFFTARMSDWWPLGSHSVSAGEGKVSQSLAIDPQVGGAVTEVGHDGTRHVWGHIQDWAPGAHFAMSWHPGKSVERQTHVRVEFAPDGDGTTVTLIHSGWEALADEGAKMRRGYNEGWVGVLGQFSEAVTASVHQV